MYIAMLGRQPEIGRYELERLLGERVVLPFSYTTALLDVAKAPDVQRLGGTIKLAKILNDNLGSWQNVTRYLEDTLPAQWLTLRHKITLGISVYDIPGITPREIQRVGLNLKKQVSHGGGSLRLIPNKSVELSSAVSHHNKLGLSEHHIELIVARSDTGKIILAQSTGAQNITAYAERDQARPKRDAFVGMLPPKLAQTIINLAVGQSTPSNTTVVLDPFCGTGVVLQEAALMGFSVAGSDISEKMINYSQTNLEWLHDKFPALDHYHTHLTLRVGDATKLKLGSFDAIATELYMGRPFSAPPAPAALREVSQTCQSILNGFLDNVARQAKSGTTMCLALPAWRQANGHFHRLDIQTAVGTNFNIISGSRVLLYYRPDQIVSRQLVILEKRSKR